MVGNVSISDSNRSAMGDVYDEDDDGVDDVAALATDEVFDAPKIIIVATEAEAVVVVAEMPRAN
jgi:hypothetical protein